MRRSKGVESECSCRGAGAGVTGNSIKKVEPSPGYCSTRKAGGADLIEFDVAFQMMPDKSETVRFIAVVGSGDKVESVLTIMLSKYTKRLSTELVSHIFSYVPSQYSHDWRGKRRSSTSQGVSSSMDFREKCSPAKRSTWSLTGIASSDARSQLYR